MLSGIVQEFVGQLLQAGMSAAIQYVKHLMTRIREYS